MRFASAFVDGRPAAGLVDGERFVPLEGIDELGAATGRDLLRDPPLAQGGSVLLHAVELRPVVPRPGKIICLGLNYRAHVEETGRELPSYPVLFTKFASTLAAPGGPIALPPESEQVDFEAELAIVVGRRSRRLSREAALDAVAGFTVANDVTMRDYQYKTHQWLQGKAWEGSTPLGPYLVTPDEVGDPGTLEIRLDLNGETMQSANTSLLIFDVPAILSHLSEFVTLEPGDVILTGSPAGVGYRREPPVFIAPGDRLRVEIERIGVLENTAVAEADLSARRPAAAAER